MDTSLSPESYFTLGFPLGVIPSMNLDKSIVASIYPYSIILSYSPNTLGSAKTAIIENFY
jgi:hypothetical protein